MSQAPAPYVEASGSRTRHDIAGIVIGVVGVALLIAVLTPTTGVLTMGVSGLLHRLLGLGALLVPLALIVWAITFFVPTNRVMPGRVACGLGLIALGVIALLGITAEGAVADPSLLFTPALLVSRGGYVGNGLAWVLLSLTGEVVGVVVLVGLLIAGLVVLGFSMTEVIQQASLRLRERREFARRQKQERAAQLAREADLDLLRAQGDMPEDYAPTALFDPDQPLGDQGQYPEAPLDGVPTSVLDRSRTGQRASTVRTFGCGDYPDVNGNGAPVAPAFAGDAPATTYLQQADIPATTYLQQAGIPEDVLKGVPTSVLKRAQGRGASLTRQYLDDQNGPALAPAASPDETTFLQPAMAFGEVPEDLDEEAFPGLAQSLGGTPQAPLRRGIDTAFTREDAGSKAFRRERVRDQRRAESASRNWWEGTDQPQADIDERDVAFADARLDVPVPGIIAGIHHVEAEVEPEPGFDPEPESEPEAPAEQTTPFPSLAGEGREVWREAASADPEPDQGLAEEEDVQDWDPEASPCVADMTPPWESLPDQAEKADQTRADSAKKARTPSTETTRLTSADRAPQKGATDFAGVSGAAASARPAAPSSDFQLPDPALLRHTTHGLKKSQAELDEIAHMGERLADVLTEFKVPGEVKGWIEGPTCTTYEIKPGQGVRVNRFTALEEDIARSLAQESVRIYTPVHGTSYIGIEVPNQTRQTVLFGDIIACVTGGPLDFAVGLDANGKPVHTDLATLPHLLIAGTTGSGKSVMVNSIICSLLMRNTPDDVRLIMVDPKQVELTGYNGIPHLVMPVVTDPHQASAALQWAVTEMTRRFKVFSNVGVRDIISYNRNLEDPQVVAQTGLKHLPYLVVIIDELTDLMMVAKKDVEASITRIAQLGRAAGVHIVTATQRPSADVVTGLIKANISNRMALKVASGIDSKVILDQTGAEKLLGHGDMLFLQTRWGSKPRRIQGCYLSDPEIANIVSHLKTQASAASAEDLGMAPMGDARQLTMDTRGLDAGGSDYADSGEVTAVNDDDPLVMRAAQLVVENQLGSTSMIQRRLKLGYARAGRVMDMLEELGVVGPARSSKPRDVLIQDLDELSALFGTEFTEGDV